jgi:Tol biopolymer transport system component
MRRVKWLGGKMKPLIINLVHGRQLLRIVFSVVIFFLILTACNPSTVSSVQESATPTPSPVIYSSTPLPPTPTLTETTTPTATVTASPTPTFKPEPTPLGGGGTLVLTLNKRLYSPMFSLPGESNLFIAQPDGTNLTPLTSGEDKIGNYLEDVSLDGSNILFSAISGDPRDIKRSGKRGDLYSIKLNGSNPIRLNDKDMTVYPNASRWLPNGRVVFIGVSSQGRAVYSVNFDGTGLTLLKNTIGGITGIAEILSLSSDSSEIYWVTGGWCGTRGVCSETYFYTKLDDSVHKQVWPWLQAGSNNISLSPDDKLIAYEPYFGQDLDSRQKNGCFIAKVDGSEINKIAPNKIAPDLCDFLGLRKAAWSPDGKYLVYWYRTKQGQGFKLYSVADKQFKDLPNTDISYCREATWFSDSQRVIIYDCYNQKDKEDVEVPALLFDLKAETVTQIPGSSSCAVVPSPDEQLLWIYDCSNPQVASEVYSIFNLNTQSSQPLFSGLHINDQPSLPNTPKTGFYIWEFQPSRWVKAGTK